jgi:alpha-beta hydrolase superfamily lysophospholipase
MHLFDKLHDITVEKYPNLPYFLYGHSMGSFIARDYISKYGEELTGVTIFSKGKI